MQCPEGVPSRKTLIAWCLAHVCHIARHEHRVIECGVEHGLEVGVGALHIHARQFVAPTLIGGAAHCLEIASTEFGCAVALAALLVALRTHHFHREWLTFCEMQKNGVAGMAKS